MTPTPITFIIPPSLSDTERSRCEVLAKSFGGRPTSAGYDFSPVRGRKFLALWKVGASCAGHWNNSNGPKYVYRLPGCGRVLELCEAMRRITP